MNLILKYFGVERSSSHETRDLIKLRDNCIKITRSAVKLQNYAFILLMFSSFYIMHLITKEVEINPINIGKNNHVERMFAYRNPVVTDAFALKWAKDRACEVLSLHFNKLNKMYHERRGYFTDESWALYVSSMLSNKVERTVLEDSLVITAVNIHNPVLSRKYIVDDRQHWEVQVDMIQTTRGASNKEESDKRTAIIDVMESSRGKELTGLKIHSLYIMD